MKAAVRSYFGIDLKDITPAQAAIIAALPKSPSNYDLVRNAEERCPTVVEEDAECPNASSSSPRTRRSSERRNQILDLLAYRPDPDVGRRVQLAGLHRREAHGGRARQPGNAALDRPPLRVGRP